MEYYYTPVFLRIYPPIVPKVSNIFEYIHLNQQL